MEASPASPLVRVAIGWMIVSENDGGGVSCFTSLSLSFLICALHPVVRIIK